jgi:class 3 adenylate cyclase/phosphoribosyl 1,2-cyclic phosphodiesterase
MAGTNQVKVTFWGVRGSIPTPQAANLGYGGETSCVAIEAEGARLILDAGSGVRTLGAAILREGKDVSENILLSHFHWDHVQGLPFFAPLYKKSRLHFHAQVPAERLHANLAAQMTAPFFPLEFDAAPAEKEYSQFTWHTPFAIGPFQVTPFPLHHPQDCTGFRVECGGKVVVYATDHEHGDAEKDAVLLQYAQGADILIADAQYTLEEYAQRKGFGHSTWMEAAKLAAAAQVGRLVLFHHDPWHGDDAVRQLVQEARRIFPQTEAARERTTLEAGERLAAGESVAEAVSETSELGLKEHPLRVLLVDDQRMVGEAVRRMLMGHTPEIEFKFCADAAGAVAMANEFAPTLILQDLIMPGVEGLDMVRAFRANGATVDVPIIVLSSKEEAATKAESFAAGANDYIVKLPDKIELLARIQHQSAAYVNRLERDEAYAKVQEEKQKSDTLLLNILPEAVATELKESGNVRAKGFDLAGVLFADFCNFTAISQTMTADELVAELNECFTAFDRITTAHGVEKLKTIGDGYLCVAGIPEPRPEALLELTRVGLEIRDYIAARRKEKIAAGRQYWDVRVGLHCGPLVAGVVGLRKFAYDVWGDTVNMASRMESAGAPGRVNISAEYRAQLPPNAVCEPRGAIAVKGKGEVEMFFLDSLG